MILPAISHRTIDIDGVPIAYRESNPPKTAGPTLLLLHGFPSGSHQFRRLIDALGAEHHLVAPDYPGFGMSGTDFPGSKEAPWTFDWLADRMEGFLDAVGLGDVVLYMFDWGGPVGMRLAQRRPASIRGLIVQNANIDEAGLSLGARDFISLSPGDPAAEEAVRSMLQEPSTRSQYLTGSRDPSRVAPEAWLLDQMYLDRGDRTFAQRQMAFDYKNNLKLYDQWQTWLETNRPPTLVTWGRHDPFFTVEGALAYLRVVPETDLHLLDAGHFALEERLETIVVLVQDFLRRRVSMVDDPEP